MASTSPHPHRFGFGAFTLDLERGALLGPEGELKLRPKSFEVLRYLVEQSGRLVGKGELLDAVWGRAVVTEDSLTQCLVEIRRALGDEARAAIRTVPRRGYIFAAKVVAMEEGGAVPSSSGSAMPRGLAARAAPPQVAGWPATLVLVAGMVVAGALAFGLARVGQRTGVDASAVTDSAPVSSQPAIAVLPFDDMSAGRDHEYFGDGIAEEILNLLAHSRELKVIARTSSFSFKGERLDIPAIAARLGVGYVLEGSVRRSGSRVRVTAQLVAGSDGAHLWSQTYDRELVDLFTVQTDIAAEVAAVLKTTLLGDGAASRHGPRDALAYEHFLRARFLFNRRDRGDLERALQEFQQAIEIDPDYAPAWAGLAGAYLVQMSEHELALETGLPLRYEAAMRALALDPDLPEARLRAAAAFADAGDLESARHHFQVAAALDPNNPLLLGNMGGWHLGEGRLDEAIEFDRRAVAVDPLSLVARLNLGYKLVEAGRFEDARAQLQLARELSPARTDDVDTVLAQIEVLEGRPEQALALLGRHEVGRSRDMVLAMAHHELGRAEDAASAVARLEASSLAESALQLAAVYAHRGDHDRAFTWLEVALQRFENQTPTGVLRWAQLSHSSRPLNVLYDDSRWVELYARARVPQ